ncbi:MAG: hypothetical protein LQ342_007023 [Letrouitia transgressa]|nr:MAG: hypothetical protein LQ342_007023 [Letrouitia transgressa]
MEDTVHNDQADIESELYNLTDQLERYAYGKIDNEFTGHSRKPVPSPAQEQAFRNKYLYDLNIDRPIRDRISAIIAVSKHIIPYSHETLDMVWLEVKDLVTANASTDSRRALLQLLSASISQSDLSLVDHISLLRTIVTLTYESMEVDRELLDSIISFANGFAHNGEMEGFDLALDALVQVATLLTTLKDQSHQSPPEEPNDVATSCLLRLFVENIQQNSMMTQQCYERLVQLSGHRNAPRTCRINVMKLLMCLRCTSERLIYLTNSPDSQCVAATLFRTEESIRSKSATQAQPAKATMIEGTQTARSGKTGTVDLSSRSGSRQSTRPTSNENLVKVTPYLWMYYSPNELPQVSSRQSNDDIPIPSSSICSVQMLNLNAWFEGVLEVLQNGDDWESLQTLLVSQLKKSSFQEPPVHSGLKKGDVALCLFNSLTILVSYHHWIGQEDLTDMVHTFLVGIGMWDRTAKSCIHALTLCCHEIPRSVDKCLSLILTKMSQIISQSHLAMDILEFLGQLARLPDAYRSIGEDPLRTIFGICISHLHHSREQRQSLLSAVDLKSTHTSSRLSGTSADFAAAPELSQSPGIPEDLPEYVYALAYTVITTWFLSISIRHRSKHVGWIAKNLAWKNKQDEEIVEEQSQVTLDMMHRTAFLDLGETIPRPIPSDDVKNVVKKTWLVGMSIVTMETNAATGMTQITKRQASGTTHAVYQQHTAPLPSHHVEVQFRETVEGTDAPLNILPNHILLQLGSTISPMPIPIQPIVLPDDEFSKRAISTLDRIDTVDGHKAGVIYVAPGQTRESQILANTSGSDDYEKFLVGLGTKVSLQGASFNTQGLDREYDTDGKYTYAWRDRITEIVFHIPTMMPTNMEYDAHCINKKRHVGNDFVNVIYNESGSPFKFDTFASQLNYVNIVITPEEANVVLPKPSIINDDPTYNAQSSTLEADQGMNPSGNFFKVQLQCAPSFPSISPAATPKIVTASALPSFVRQLVLNASVFSLVWSNRGGGEHVSSWRSRLREIRKLRDRYSNTAMSANVAYPGMGTPEDRGGARSYVEGDDWKGTLSMGGLAEHGQFLMSLDFTRWA